MTHDLPDSQTKLTVRAGTGPVATGTLSQRLQGKAASYTSLGSTGEQNGNPTTHFYLHNLVFAPARSAVDLIPGRKYEIVGDDGHSQLAVCEGYAGGNTFQFTGTD